MNNNDITKYSNDTNHSININIDSNYIDDKNNKQINKIKSKKEKQELKDLKKKEKEEKIKLKELKEKEKKEKQELKNKIKEDKIKLKEDKIKLKELKNKEKQEKLKIKQKKEVLKPYQDLNKIELGIDEAGRGCLFGDLFVAGVIFPKNIQELIDENNVIIKDSKKMSKKKRLESVEFIKKHALTYYVCQVSSQTIDEKNILVATLDGMTNVVENIINEMKIDKILVDGNKFNKFIDKDGVEINHECVIGGDNSYLCIAGASILAKTAKDLYIEKLVENNQELEKYDLISNSGYGTQRHIEAIEKYGISDWHRKSFSICNKEKTLLKKEMKMLKNKIENEEKEKEKINKNIEDYFCQDL
jgi:ribonuclease HII